MIATEISSRPDEPLASGDDADVIARRLAEPFPPELIKWKPGAVSGNRALALAYIDARLVMDRLDEVLGALGWSDSYEFLAEGSVLCRLKIRVGAEWISKEDVGGESEQPDEGDRRKAGVSDALKRAAVKFGIGRFLYRLPPQWVDYDPRTKRFTQPPSLRLPMGEAKPRVEPPTTARVSQAAKSAGLADPGETQRRVASFEGSLVRDGLCAPGELPKYLTYILGDLWRQTGLEDVEAACREFHGDRKAAKTNG